ncbi:RNA helicase [cyanobacterium TDX16]|nr:RNA helicase [cyanobacterium TDX16]
MSAADPEADPRPIPETFDALGVSADLVKVLADKGITKPFPIQALTVQDAMAGRDVCGKAKTGSGKTLAFGLPMIERVSKAKAKRPVGLVLVPTRELALQVHDELKPLGEARDRKVTAVYGGADMDKQIRQLQDTDVVVATPGRMIDLLGREEVSVADLELVVVDEADRMADMGFLPQVEWILRRVDEQHQTLLFSATLDGVIEGLVQRYQHDPVFHEVGEKRMAAVEEMEHRFLAVHEMDKAKVAAAISQSADRTIMFTNTKRAADRLERDLEKLGVDARAIHGDRQQRVREKALSQFADGTIPVLVATDVAARGIHVDDVDVVIHFDPPEDHKAYLHRSGRTARAGESGLVVTLVLYNEELHVRRLQTRVGVKQPIVEMFSNDKRLADLSSWDPTA